MKQDIFKEIQIQGQVDVDGNKFPKALTPVENLNFIQLQSYFANNAQDIIKDVNKHGAVFFRGFGIQSPTQFSTVITQLGIPSFEYVGGAAVRKLIVGSTSYKTPAVEVFTTNEAPPEQPIPFHNELMQNESYPDYVSFFCFREADEGGSTPLVHSGELYQYISDKHPQFLEKLKKLGVRYIRVVGKEDNEKSPIGRGWKNIFKASEKGEAEKKMAETGYEFEWIGNETEDCRLVSKVLPAVKVSKSGVNVFANQMIAVFKGWIDDKNSPSKCLKFGDLSELPIEVMEDIANFADQRKAQIDWQCGDFVLIDNEMAKHARQPFKGVNRKIYASLMKGSRKINAQQKIVLRSGDMMPLVGFGTWKLPNEVAEGIIYQAIKGGIRLIDCAACYGNQKEVGRGIRKAIDEGIVTREDLWVTSKLWNCFHEPKYVKPALQRTLSDLGLDYLDLYLIHWPFPIKYVDPAVKYPIDFGFTYPPTGEEAIIEQNVTRLDTWRAMEPLVKEGLVRNIGVSNFKVSLIRDLMAGCEIKPAVNQIEIHPYLTQKKMIQYCQENDIQVTSFSTMGGNSYVEMGMSTVEEAITEKELVKNLGAKYGRTPAQIILRWAIQQGLAIIPKTSKEARLKENSDLFDWTLTAEEMTQIDGLNINKRYCDPIVFCLYYGREISVFE